MKARQQIIDRELEELKRKVATIGEAAGRRERLAWLVIDLEDRINHLQWQFDGMRKDGAA